MYDVVVNVVVVMYDVIIARRNIVLAPIGALFLVSGLNSCKINVNVVKKFQFFSVFIYKKSQNQKLARAFFPMSAPL